MLCGTLTIVSLKCPYLASRDPFPIENEGNEVFLELTYEPTARYFVSYV